jgi:putative ABC transport system permease protein
MVPIARRNLLAEKFRLVIAVGGVAFAVFLIVIIQSLYQGFRTHAGDFSRDFPADLWVVQKGMADLARSNSHVPQDLLPEVARLPGVRAVMPAHGRLQRVTIAGRSDTAFLMAFKDGPAAGPAMQRLGYSAPPARGEIIAHKSIASVGETIDVDGRELKVVNTYEGGIPTGGFSFINYEDAAELFAVPGYDSFFVVLLEAPGQAESVSTAIRAVDPRLETVTGARLSSYLSGEIDSFLPIFAVLLVIGFLVGAAVISLIIYTATIERARDYAVLKALGATNFNLYRVVLTQSFIVGVLGFVVGVPVASLVAAYVQLIVPEFLTELDFRPVVLVLIAVIIMSSVAAYLPARRIAQIDPAAVFRA